MKQGTKEGGDKITVMLKLVYKISQTKPTAYPERTSLSSPVPFLRGMLKEQATGEVPKSYITRSTYFVI